MPGSFDKRCSHKGDGRCRHLWPGLGNGRPNALFVHGAQDKGVANAATQVSGLELGGLFGSLSSGAISDHLVRSNDGSKGNVGLRVQARHAPP